MTRFWEGLAERTRLGFVAGLPWADREDWGTWPVP